MRTPAPRLCTLTRICGWVITIMKASELKKGLVIAHEGEVYQIRDIERSAPTARGASVIFRLTLYSVPGNRKFDLALRADDSVTEVDLVRRQVTFSYMDGTSYVFMDSEDYTQYPLDAETIGDAAGYVVAETEGYFVQLIDGAAVGLQVPPTVALAVLDTAPELKGASATKRSKPARLETGLEIQVPEYITTGERVLVNTTTGSFSGRA